MMKTAKHTLHIIGDQSGEIARTIGSGTAGLARRVGGGTADLAKRIGPKRGLIGLALLAAAIGGSVVVIRYLRARDANRALGADDAAGDATSGSARHARARARADHPAEALASR